MQCDNTEKTENGMREEKLSHKMGTQTTINKKKSAGEERTSGWKFSCYFFLFVFVVAFCCVCFFWYREELKKKTPENNFMSSYCSCAWVIKKQTAKKRWRKKKTVTSTSRPTWARDHEADWTSKTNATTKDARGEKRARLTVIIGNEVEFAFLLWNRRKIRV